jgi:Bacterial regulatory helix-turn-helix protein, lysR family
VLDDLHALVEFAQAGSIVGAADRLFRTPSAITRQLQRLRLHFKFPLDGELRLCDHAVQFHRRGVREEVGESFAHLSGDDIRIADVLRRHPSSNGTSV